MKKYTLEELIQFANDPNPRIRIKAARNPRTPAEILEKLAEDITDTDIISCICSNISTPISVLEKLFNYTDLDLKPYIYTNFHFLIAGSPNLTDEMRNRLLKADTSNIKCILAGNNKTPVHILEKFAEDEDWNVRNSVAENSNTPVHILEKLFEEKEENYTYLIKRSIACNPNVPVHILEKIAENEEYLGYPFDFWRNKKLPASFIEKLFEKRKLEHYDWYEMARHINTPVYILGVFAKIGNDSVRLGLARNRKAPARILEILSDSEEMAIRRNVAANPRTGIRTLRKLTNDKYAVVRKKAVKRLAKKQVNEKRKMQNWLI